MKKPKKKGFTPITSVQVTSILDLLAKAQASLGSPVVLSTKERQGQLKLRRGAQQVVPTIAVLASKHGLEMPSLPIADMTSKIEHAQRLREVHGVVLVLQKQLSDAILASESDGWSTATATYSMLRRAAKSRPDLLVELAPVEHWFKNAHRGAKAPAEGAPAATPAASSNATPVAAVPAVASKPAGTSVPTTPTA